MNYSAIKLTAPIKDYLWGGMRLVTDYGKKTDKEKAAESWELSTHPDGESIVSRGEFKGLTLSEYIKANGGDECIGHRAAGFDFFPILIKFIDAKDNLSIQVHPDDEYALRVEGEYGKTEMWYIVDCEEDSFLYYGVNREVSKDEFRERIENNTLLEILNKVPVKKGDVFFMPSGTIHAICSGILICEIQQNSNTTYRVYDYDRRGADGKPRELHIEKAIDVSRLTPSQISETANSDTLASCKYFTVKKVVCENTAEFTVDSDCFRSLTVTDGCGKLELNGDITELSKGDTVFIPAQNATVKLSGDFEAIIAYV
ncbi:MAG: class I mannose-6-phosphate isomerase [Clostridia bacterium]|nr:class I mannose-6-phosphate isomerase [Clostridia bacterium]